MGPEKQKIKIKENPPALLHSTYNSWIEHCQKKAHQLSTLPGGVDVFVISWPPKTSTGFISDRHRSLKPARRPDPNQEHRSRAAKEELAALDRMLEKVRERIRFLESASEQNVVSSSHQGGDLTSPTLTPVGDVTADQS